MHQEPNNAGTDLGSRVEEGSEEQWVLNSAIGVYVKLNKGFVCDYIQPFIVSKVVIKQFLLYFVLRKRSMFSCGFALLSTV